MIYGNKIAISKEESVGVDLFLNKLGEKASEPCSAYDAENGRCKDSGRMCDGCYENSLKNWNNE